MLMLGVTDGYAENYNNRPYMWWLSRYKFQIWHCEFYKINTYMYS